MQKETTTSVQTLDRVMTILDCFNADTPRLPLKDVIDRVGLSRSTTHRLLTAMEQHGLLRRQKNGQDYSLGYQLLHYASLTENTLDIREQARPILEALAEESQETAVLMVREDKYAVCLDRIDSKQSLRLAMTIGKRVALHAGSSAKVLLAYLKEKEINAILDDDLVKVLENTVTDPKILKKELEQIREQGFAHSIEERDVGAAGITAPVFNSANEVVAGLGIVGPVSRLNPESLQNHIQLVKKLTSKLSRQLGSSNYR